MKEAHVQAGAPANRLLTMVTFPQLLVGVVGRVEHDVVGGLLVGLG